jgi:hypothetical protein
MKDVPISIYPYIKKILLYIHVYGPDIGASQTFIAFTRLSNQEGLVRWTFRPADYVICYTCTGTGTLLIGAACSGCCQPHKILHFQHCLISKFKEVTAGV